MSDNTPVDVLTGGGACCVCGRNPALGYASIVGSDGVERWYCHPDSEPSCYAGDTPPVDVPARLREKAKVQRADALAFRETWGITADAGTRLEADQIADLLDLLADAYEEIDNHALHITNAPCGHCSLLSRIEEAAK